MSKQATYDPRYERGYDMTRTDIENDLCVRFSLGASEDLREGCLNGVYKGLLFW